jgi:hypothetical protein
MASLTTQRVAGGAFGAGGTLGARQILDEPGQNRYTQPSVLFGLGTGVLAGALWYTDVETPVVTDDFWASHAMTALPSGALSLLFPKSQDQSLLDGVLGQAGLGGSTNGRANTQRARQNGATVETTSGRRAR